MSREFVIGDIHGGLIPLQQCLERCGFDREKDLLITIGDICDGWPYVMECIDELLSIKNRIDIVGNHDVWFYLWLLTGEHPDKWRQGGKGTATSYLRPIGKEFMFYDQYGITQCSLLPEDIPATHKQFFKNQKLYYKDTKNRLFVHGGFFRMQPLALQAINNPSLLYWDRDLWDEALSVHRDQKLKFCEEFSEIFIGHTTTINWTNNETLTKNGIILPRGKPRTTPMHADIVWNIDTGGGSSGRLTIMDINTHEYWQSDPVNDIYGDYKPRG